MVVVVVPRDYITRFNSNLTCLHVDRCFRQNFQPDSQISVIVTPCLADIQKKKKRSHR